MSEQPPTRTSAFPTAAIVAISVVLTLGIVFAVSFLGSAPVKIEVTPNRNSCVFVSVTNTSSRLSFKTYNDCLNVLPSRFVSSGPAGKVTWRNPATGPPTTNYVLEPRSSLRLEILLPSDGRMGRVSVGFSPPKNRLHIWLQSIARKLGFRLPNEDLLWFEYPKDIQAPRVIPSGGWEPMHILGRGSQPGG